MVSIEEAWAEFDKASVNAWEWHPDVEDAVRVLVLAAVDETLTEVNGLLDREKSVVTKIALPALCRRIEALGKVGA